VTEGLINSQVNLLYFCLSKFIQSVKWFVMIEVLFQHRSTSKVSRLKLTVAPLPSYGECNDGTPTMKWASTLLPTFYTLSITLKRHFIVSFDARNLRKSHKS